MLLSLDYLPAYEDDVQNLWRGQPVQTGVLCSRHTLTCSPRLLQGSYPPNVGHTLPLHTRYG